MKTVFLLSDFQVELAENCTSLPSSKMMTIFFRVMNDVINSSLSVILYLSCKMFWDIFFITLEKRRA